MLRRGSHKVEKQTGHLSQHLTGLSRGYCNSKALENEDHGIRSNHFMGNRWGNSGKEWLNLFFWAPKSLQMVTAAMKLEDAYSLEGKL